MPDSTVGDVAKELGRRWNDCTEDQKSKYEALAAKDKARYEKENNAYKSKKPKTIAPAAAKGKAKAAPAPADSDDEDEEEEEDEDDDDDDDE